MMPAVLGIDPGPTRSGYALIARAAPRTLRFVRGGLVTSAPAPLDRLLDGLEPGSGVAVESPADYLHDRARARHVLATKGVAHEILAMARDRGHAVVPITARRVRGALCGKGLLGGVGRGTPGDAAVKAAIGLLVGGWPARSSAHVRDAAMVAVFALLNERTAVRA